MCVPSGDAYGGIGRVRRLRYTGRTLLLAPRARDARAFGHCALFSASRPACWIRLPQSWTWNLRARGEGGGRSHSQRERLQSEKQ